MSAIGAEDLVGRTFGTWTVVERVPLPGRAAFACRCVCGTRRVKRSHHVKEMAGKPCRCPGSLMHRFWSKTKIEGGCIVWTASLAGFGYGKFCLRKGVFASAHRWIYESVVGAVGQLEVMHDCDNPRCVKLQHLSAGTRQRNAADCVARGRHVKGELHRHSKLTAVDVALIREAAARGDLHATIARRHGVGRQQIAKIVRRHAWRHVP